MERINLKYYFNIPNYFCILYKTNDMVRKLFRDEILLGDKRHVLLIHLYFRFLQYGIRPFENDMDIIVELYLFGGYSNAQQQSMFINKCIEKGYKKSEQSVRNTLSKYVNIGVFNKTKNTHLSVNDKFIPPVECDQLILNHVISHAI